MDRIIIHEEMSVNMCIIKRSHGTAGRATSLRWSPATRNVNKIFTSVNKISRTFILYL